MNQITVPKNYEITVWGSIPNQKFNNIFNAQKSCLVTGNDFSLGLRLEFELDHILNKTFQLHLSQRTNKPLFNKNKILNLKNLYLYHCALKILKFRSPIVAHNL